MGEATYPTFGRFKWNRMWWGITSTPVTPPQVADAHMLFIATRLLISSAMYYLVLLAFGAAGGPRGRADDPDRGAVRVGLRGVGAGAGGDHDDDGPLAFNLLCGSSCCR